MRVWNEDATVGAAKIESGSVDLVLSDPPFGIADPQGVYNRDESLVLDGYVEVPSSEYPAFTRKWLSEAERILRPGGSLVVVSGWSNLYTILNALQFTTKLQEVNHIIWRFSFGPYTRRKFVSSHYHVLYWCKPPDSARTFNRQCRFGEDERSASGSLLYHDLEDVWVIPREYKPGEVKNKNRLPDALVAKILQYCSVEGDLVSDFFLGSFTTARMSKALGRHFCGFEMSTAAYDLGVASLAEVGFGDLLPMLRAPETGKAKSRGANWSEHETAQLALNYRALRDTGRTKKAAVSELCDLHGRGRFGVERMLRKMGAW